MFPKPGATWHALSCHASPRDCPVLPKNTCNSNYLGIRRNSNVYLDFVRLTQRQDPCHHARSREFPGLQPGSIGLLYPRSHNIVFGTLKINYSNHLLVSWMMHDQDLFHLISTSNKT